VSQSIRSLIPEDELLVIAIHGGKFAWSQLKWLSDLAEPLRTYQMLGGRS